MIRNYCKQCYKQNIDSQIKDEDLIYASDENVCDGCGEVRHLVINTSKSDETNNQMTVAECQVETQKHIEHVRKYVRFMIDKIDLRGVKHDASKLESPEVEVFAEYTSKLNNTAFGSDEYYANLEKMKPALDHHYASNRHHPEHFVNGINDMTLVDIIEMFCDWKASTLRHNDGNLLKSIETNAERFNIEGQLKQIFLNTARMIDEQE